MWRLRLQSPIRSLQVGRLEVTPGFAAALCLLGLTAQRDIVPAFLAAMAAHEAGHLIALRALGGRICTVRLGFFDARIVSSLLGYRQEMLAALAGPFVSALCGVLFQKRLPSFAAISLLLGAFNLLPVWPLDGGRALRAGLGLHMSLNRAEAVSRAVGRAVGAVGLACALFCTGRYGLGMLPVFIWGTVLLRLIWYGREERACKSARRKV